MLGVGRGGGRGVVPGVNERDPRESFEDDVGERLNRIRESLSPPLAEGEGGVAKFQERVRHHRPLVGEPSG